MILKHKNRNKTKISNKTVEKENENNQEKIHAS